MQTEISKKVINILFFIFFFHNCNVSADEFNISAKEIIINKDNQIITGIGNVKAQDADGKVIYADKITYKKSNEFLLAEGSVKIIDNKGNILITNKASYDKLNEIIVTFNETKLFIKENYKLVGKNLFYNTLKNTLSSSENSILTDIDGNKIKTTMFNHDIAKNLFTSIGKIKVTDIKKNIYNFKEIYVDTLKNEMIGSNVSVVLDQESFGLNKENDPRMVANDIFVSENKIKLSKGVFTVCQKRDGKCPPWSIKARNIIYDKSKKNIYYHHAILKLYDVPIFYFPRFFHPEPSVKRQSGFLFPTFSTNSNAGSGFLLPYYWAINNDKDLTFSPQYYNSENPLFLNEYRQAFNNGLLILDTSFTEGFKKTSTTKLDGSRNHIYANLDLELNKNNSYTSDLNVKFQSVSNDTYFKKHKINTFLVNSESTQLDSSIDYNFSKDDIFLNISGSMYENLSKKKDDRYEYVLPNVLFGKTFFTEKFGVVDFTSNALYNEYGFKKNKTLLTNDVVWKSNSKVTKKGFLNSFEGMLRNSNYKTKRTTNYKNGDAVNELHSVLAFKSSLPMKKNGINYSKLFSPNYMIRYAPGHVRDMSDNDLLLNRSNLYALNKTSEIEDGLSAVLGFDFKVNNNQKGEKLSFSLGQIFNYKKNDDIPSKSSLDQKMSDVVGDFNYNFSEIGNIGYKFLLDHNFNDLNYQEITTGLDFGKVAFNLDYLEENNHVGLEHYINPEVSINFNKQSKLSLGTKKNFKTDSTEFYNLSYQYEIDCLTAGLVYRREFYQDSEIAPSDNLLFSITFVPFSKVTTPKKQ